MNEDPVYSNFGGIPTVAWICPNCGRFQTNITTGGMDMLVCAYCHKEL